MNILIFGATGWFGRSTIDFLHNVYKDNCNFTLISSKKGFITYKKNKFIVHDLDYLKKLINKSYDYYFDYAFLTGQTVSSLDKDTYINKTDELIYTSNTFLKNNIIKKALLTSSGAIYWNNTNKETVYSIQKSKQEKFFIEICENLEVNYTIARVFAVISKFYNLTSHYAFTNFLQQAKKNKLIKVESKKRVLRSYLVYENLLNYFLNENTKVYDAWNVNLDIVELAEVISKIYNSKLVVDENYFKSKHEDIYISNDFTFRNKSNISSDLENIISYICNYTELNNMNFSISNP